MVDDSDVVPDEALDDESAESALSAEPALSAESADHDAAEQPFERPIDKFRRSSAGSVIAAGLLGVRDALEGRPEREEPAIVAEAPEPKLDHIDIVLDPDHPERSRAVVYLPPREEPTDPA